MTNDDTVPSYFISISQIRNQIQQIGESIAEQELVIKTLNGLPISWDAFAAGVSSWKEVHIFEKLWTLCGQEEEIYMIVKMEMSKPLQIASRTRERRILDLNTRS